MNNNNNQPTYLVAKCMYPAIGRDVQYVSIGLTKQAIEARHPNARKIEYTTVEFDPNEPVVSISIRYKFIDHTDEFVVVATENDGWGIPTIRYITCAELKDEADIWYIAKKLLTNLPTE